MVQKEASIGVSNSKHSSSNSTSEIFLLSGVISSHAKRVSAFQRMVNVLGIKADPKVLVRIYEENLDVLKKLADDPTVAGMSPADEYNHYLLIWQLILIRDKVAMNFLSC